MKKLIFLIILLLLPLNASAQRTKLAAALIEESVLLTSSFNGTKVTMFGALEMPKNQQTDMIIVIRGPDRPAWISEKSRIFGLWIGSKRVKFETAPTFFGIASTRPIEKIAPNDTLNLYGITPISQLNIIGDYSSAEQNHYKNAFVAKRSSQGLFVKADIGVKFMQDSLFRADLNMPDLTAPGLYSVKVFVFRNGRPLDTHFSTFVVTKVGIERAIYRFARDHKILHGLWGVCIAMGAGFLSARVFRRFTNL